MIPIRFACGHAASVSETATTVPVCATCGERQITRVQARPPRFTGACTGPYAVTKALDPIVVNVAPKGALTLKPSEE